MTLRAKEMSVSAFPEEGNAKFALFWPRIIATVTIKETTGNDTGSSYLDIINFLRETFHTLKDAARGILPHLFYLHSGIST